MKVIGRAPGTWRGANWKPRMRSARSTEGSINGLQDAPPTTYSVGLGNYLVGHWQQRNANVFHRARTQ